MPGARNARRKENVAMEVLETFAIPGAAIVVLFLVAFFWPKGGKSSKGDRTTSSRAHPAA